MKKSWFKKLGWIYVPVSVQGIIISLLITAFSVHVFIFVDSRSHSVSDTLFGIFPYIVPSFLIYLWIGHESSK